MIVWTNIRFGMCALVAQMTCLGEARGEVIQLQCTTHVYDRLHESPYEKHNALKVDTDKREIEGDWLSNGPATVQVTEDALVFDATLSADECTITRHVIISRASGSLKTSLSSVGPKCMTVFPPLPDSEEGGCERHAQLRF